MSPYRDQVAAALRAMTIRGPTRYAWLGHANRALAPALEAEMGVTLLERGRRGARPTSAGEALVAHADAILAQLDAAEAEVAAIAGLRGGQLAMASFPTAGATIMPLAVATFRAAHPEVTLSLAEGEPEEIAPRLVVSYACAYAVGAALSSLLLSRTVGGLAGRLVLRFLVRLAVAVAVSSAVGWGLRELILDWLDGTGKLASLGHLAGVGLGFLLVYLLMARLLRITEVADVMSVVTRRLRR